jgi:hypothetical protein
MESLQLLQQLALDKTLADPATSLARMLTPVSDDTNVGGNTAQEIQLSYMRMVATELASLQQGETL